MTETAGGAGGEGFRVLAVDGGGVRGIFAASFLATVEEQLGAPVARHFDLLVGTSTGAIIVIGLALGVEARRILELYTSRAVGVFGKPSPFGGYLWPKHRNDGLVRELRDLFGTKVLNDVETPVCVTSYELTNSYPRIWKDDHRKGLSAGGNKMAWQIALASSAAPLFLPAAQVAPGDSHVDGGLFASNPALIGITEAVRYFGQPLSAVSMLSIGAGELAERIPYARARAMGLVQWRSQIIEHMFIAQARMTHEVARCLLDPEQYVRVNIALDRAYDLDDFRGVVALREPGAQEARVRLPGLVPMFFTTPATVGRTQMREARRKTAAPAPTPP